ncbi:uncharacterized protein TNCV_1164881 [Trichonephila clavipes]|nr:uncharacterized protein TNCV_1164881 [Trichonephila clavipes]
MYNWGNTEFSTISSVFSVIGTIAMLISVSVFKRFNLGDPTLGIVGNTSLLVKNLALGLATKPEIYFAASLLGLLGGLSTLAGRSRISKVTSKDDIDGDAIYLHLHNLGMELWREGKYSPAPCTRGLCCDRPQDSGAHCFNEHILRVYSEGITWHGYRTQAFRSEVRRSNH